MQILNPSMLEYQAYPTHLMLIIFKHWFCGDVFNVKIKASNFFQILTSWRSELMGFRLVCCNFLDNSAFLLFTMGLVLIKFCKELHLRKTRFSPGRWVTPFIHWKGIFYLCFKLKINRRCFLNNLTF